jgi:hypothetical protein
MVAHREVHAVGLLCKEAQQLRLVRSRGKRAQPQAEQAQPPLGDERNARSRTDALWPDGRAPALARAAEQAACCQRRHFLSTPHKKGMVRGQKLSPLEMPIKAMLSARRQKVSPLQTLIISTLLWMRTKSVAV